MQRLQILKPTRGLHDGSSFREMLDMWRERNICDVIDNIEENIKWGDETQWIQSRPWVNKVGDILLYDQPILDKFNPTLIYNLALFSNEVKKDEKCSSWTFWPNHPREHEKVKNEGIPNYDEREHESCFIGSYTTPYRNNYNEYAKYIQHFWMGGGNQRLMTQNEYLNFIKRNKFGLCLRGVGPKCLRDVELIGMGTVPIFTEGVSTDYYNPLIKDVHFLYAEKPDDIPKLIENCTKEHWEIMSKNCLDWFDENCSVMGVYNLTCKIINNFYENKNIL